MFNEIIRLFMEFEKEQRRFNTDRLAAQIEQGDKAEIAYRYYNKAKSQGINNADRRRQFAEFLERRRMLSETLEKSVLEEHRKEIEQGAEEAAESALQQLADKMTSYYFKIGI